MAQTARETFDEQAGIVSGLEILLPQETKTHVAIPFFVSGEPAFMLVVTSARKAFSAAERTFIKSMGTVLEAHAVQRSVIETDAAKTTFLSSISHELRTPLHGLLGQIDVIRQELSQGADASQSLDIAEACGNVLQEILNDVLDYGKISESAPPASLRVVETDLRAAVVETSKACYYRMQKWASGYDESGHSHAVPIAPLSLVLHFEDRSSWDAAVDASGFRRILLNLVSNALKYTHVGEVSISLSTVRDDSNAGRDLVECSVSDTGRGIAEEFIPKLFRPFTQADAFATGAGLGLYITRQILERMGGTIIVSSVVGRGSTFKVRLPVKFVDSAADKPRGAAPMTTQRYSFVNGSLRSRNVSHTNTHSRDDCSSVSSSAPSEIDVPLKHSVSPAAILASAQAAAASTALANASKAARDSEAISSPASSTRSPSPVPTPSISSTTSAHDDWPELRVLVADDNAISRRVLLHILKGFDGTRVVPAEATDGLEAVEVFRRFRPQLVWTDVSMPRLDGITAASRMRALERENDWPRAHIVAITGLGASDNRLKLDAMLGDASLDEWRVKGQDSLTTFRTGVIDAQKRLIDDWSATHSPSPLSQPTSPSSAPAIPEPPGRLARLDTNTSESTEVPAVPS